MLSILHLVSSALTASLVEYKINFLAFWPSWSYHLTIFRHLIKRALSNVLLVLLVSDYRHSTTTYSIMVFCTQTIGSIVGSESLRTRYDLLLLLLLALLHEVVRGEHLLTLVHLQRHVFAFLTLSLLHLLLLTTAVVVTVAERALSFLRTLSMIVFQIVWHYRCWAIFTRRESHSLTVLIDDVVVDGHYLVLGVGQKTTIPWVLIGRRFLLNRIK